MVAGWHDHLHGLATAIHETFWLVKPLTLFYMTHLNGKKLVTMKKLQKVSDYWLVKLGDSVNLIPGEDLFFRNLLEIAIISPQILEVGIGRGRMAKMLKKEGVSGDFIGIDLTRNVVKSGTKGIIGDTRRLPFRDNSFALTYSLGVVEHFPDTGVAIKEHARVTEPEGHILITTPHLSLLTPIRYLVYFFTDRKYGTFEETKGRNITIRRMKKYFAEADISVINSGFYGIWGLDYFLRKYAIGRFALKLQKTAIFGSYLYLIGQIKA